jgi:hypothetical protein
MVGHPEFRLLPPMMHGLLQHTECMFADEWPDDYAEDIRKHRYVWDTETEERNQKNQILKMTC